MYHHVNPLKKNQALIPSNRVATGRCVSMSLDDPAKFVTCKDELSFCNVGPIDLRVCGTSHHRGFARTPEPKHPKVRSFL